MEAEWCRVGGVERGIGEERGGGRKGGLEETKSGRRMVPYKCRIFKIQSHGPRNAQEPTPFRRFNARDCLPAHDTL